MKAWRCQERAHLFLGDNKLYEFIRVHGHLIHVPMECRFRDIQLNGTEDLLSHSAMIVENKQTHKQNPKQKTSKCNQTSTV